MALLVSLLGFSPATAATFPCSVGPADIPTLHFQNAGDGSYQSIGLTVTAISATSGNCAALPSTTSIRPLYMGMVGAPGVPLSPATSQGGGLERIGAGVVAYKPPSPSFSGTDTFTVDNNNTTRVINVTVIVDPAPGGAPTVTSVSPSSGGTSGGTSVTITGTGFSGATSVNFGGSSAPSFSVNSATSITATSPAGTGTVDITVTASGGTSPTGAADQFTYISPPSAAAKSASAAYQTATPIDISGSITGSHSSIAIGSAASHGTTGISGDVVTYTPANGYAGSDSFTYTATGPGGTSAPATVSITVTAPTILMSPSAGSLPGVTEGSAYSQTISGSGGTAPYTFVITAGAIPAGLTLSSVGTLSGTPTASGVYNFTITATDAFSFTASTAYSLTVAAAVPVAGGVSATVAANSSANPVTLNLSGGAATSVAVASGASHGTATASGASITYTPTAGYSGSDSFTYTATNISGSSPPATVTVTVSAPTIILSPSTLPGATEGSAYSQTVSASAGTAPYSFAVTAGAIPSGTSLSSAGILSGTPTANGTFNFTVTATDTNSATGSQSYSLSVAIAAPVAGSASTTVAANSSANPITLNLSGGAASSVAIASAAGHGTATASGTSITYTPTAGYSGSDSFTYTGTNTTGTSAPATVTITVSAPTISLVPSTLPGGTQGTAFSQTITASSGTAPYSYTVTSGTLPAGLTLSSAGALSGTPSVSGTFNFTVTASDTYGATGSAAFSLPIAIEAPIAGSASATVAANSSANPITLSLSGGAAASVAVAGAASHGTASASGTSITYTPTAGYSGSDSFTYTATNTTGTSAPAAVNIIVGAPALTFSPSTLPNSTEGNAYSQTITTSGGTAPYDYAVTAGSLPSGITLSTTGTLSGTPTANGTFNFTVGTTDANGATGSLSYSLSIAVQAPVAGSVSTTVAASSSANPITLNLSGGAASIVAIASAAGHGTATASGTSITYTPTAGYSGSDSFTYTATNITGTSAPATVTITVSAPTIVLSPTTLPGATEDSAYSQTVSASAGAAPYSYAISSGALPAGLTLSSAGALSGTPAAAGSFGFIITATDTHGATGSGSYTLVVSVQAPTAGSVSATVAANSSANPVALNLSGGAATSVAVASAAGHGTATASGTAITYTPTVGYSGSDSFTYTATNPSGTSAPATVTVTVGAPAFNFSSAAGALPAASVGTAYNQPITASGGAAPYHYSISTGTLPAGINLDTATGTLSGTPTASGTFSFTLMATDANGATGTAAYSLSVVVGAPLAGNVSATVAANSTANPISLALSGGAATSAAIAGQPSHGTATASGTSITYTPAAGYSGPDSFTYTVSNASGTSEAATISVTVTPPAPVVHDATVTATTSTVQASNTSVIDLSALTTGQVDDIQVTSMPAHGTVTINAPAASPMSIASPRSVGRFRASYIPNAGYVGIDSFAFIASGPGGTSAPATVTIQIVSAPPTAASLSGNTTDGKTISFDVTGRASGGPFTDADIVSITPSGAATATLVASGAVGSRSYTLDVTPRARFDGRIVVTYRLANGAGFSAPATVTVNVTARPDPSADPVVRGISDAQAETARRFSQTQLDNFMRRTEMLHGTGGGRAVMGIRLASRDSLGIGDDPSRPDQLGVAANESGSRDGDKDHANAGANPQDPAPVAFWMAGTIQIGTRDRVTRRAKLSATTTGLSGGIDVRISSRLALGIGAGYGRDHTDVGAGAAGVSAESKLIAVYASASPAPAWFIDAVAGHGRLDFDSDRMVAAAGAIARGSRSGNFTMGSLSSGIDRQRGQWRWSAYARGDYLSAVLNAYREYGSGIYDLRFDRREVHSVKGVLGFRMAIAQPTQFGAITGRLRGEWQHEFQGVAAQGLDYADITGSSFYTIGSQGWSREQFVASPGVTIDLPADWKLDLELGWQVASGERDARSRIHISKQF